MQGLVCPEGPSMTVGCPQRQGRTTSFYQEKGPLLTSLGIGQDIGGCA